MKGIALLGASGSIGQNTLRVLELYRDRFKLIGVSVHMNVEMLFEIEKKFNPSIAVITSQKEPPGKLKAKVLKGVDGLIELAENPEVDIVVVATAGTIGVFPTIKALQCGKRVALANKETLVSFGPFVKKVWDETEGEIVPIDSEHSALFQLIEGRKKELDRLIITASGGPFRDWPKEKLENVTPEDALKHPTWRMGRKITVDSATLMNKGLEVIEAHYLFDISVDKIEVLIHPQSVIHGMLKLKDGAFLAHMSVPDMKIPILYSLTYPDRLPLPIVKPLDLIEYKKLEFYKPDYDKFPALRIAYESINEGGTVPAVMNGANEVAVHAFLDGRIKFTDIPRVIESVITSHKKGSGNTIEELVEADRWSREEATRIIENLYR